MQYNPNSGKSVRVLIPGLFIFLIIGMSIWLVAGLSAQGNLQNTGNDTLQVITEATVAEADSLNAEATAATVAETTAYQRGNYTKQDLRRGERLFWGLVPFGSGLHNCASCHSPGQTDTLNWNPSAYDLAKIWSEDETYRISEKVNNPTGTRMMTDHEGMTISQTEERQLEAYFEEVLKKGHGQLQAYPVRAFIFWGLGALMLLALLDLFVTRKVKTRVLHVLVLFAGLTVHLQFAVAESRNLGRTQNYAPDQPIKFSHQIHAGENAIDCNYCHTITKQSPSAGFPSNNTCLNCHNVIREGTNSGRFEINKIHRAAEAGEPIRWIRIHKLPDHSFFSHAQHVNAGKLDCQECHGPVEEMHILRQVEDLSMGWCLTCHRDTDVDFLNNPYFQIYKKLHQDIKDGKIDAVTAARVGGEDCMKCHY